MASISEALKGARLVDMDAARRLLPYATMVQQQRSL
jgi:hypothetical protein